MSGQAKSNSLILLCSLNVNWSNAATHTAMYIIAESKDPVFNIFLVQEPWWEKINQENRTISFPGWQTVLPKQPIWQSERPRVAAYFKIGANIDVTLRNDLMTNLDVMALNIKWENDVTEATRIINIYNQKQLGDHAHPNYTSDCITALQWDLHILTIITGNWNICHPRWDNRVQSACPRTHETLEWIEGNGFTLCNEPFMPTREDSMGHALVINLTFKNLQQMAAMSWENTTWTPWSAHSWTTTP